MEIVRKLVQSVWKLIQWWINKVKTSNNLKIKLIWLFGGLLAVCFLCSFVIMLMPVDEE